MAQDTKKKSPIVSATIWVTHQVKELDEAGQKEDKKTLWVPGVSQSSSFYFASSEMLPINGHK